MDYTYTDQIIAYIDRQLTRIFSRVRSILPIDEINVMEEKNRLYRQIVVILKRAFLTLAQVTYRAGLYNEENDKGSITEQWVDALLSGYDEQLSYVPVNELERRAARFAESYIGSRPEERPKRIDDFMKSVSLMARGLAVKTTDEAYTRALTDSGENLFQWIAEDDSKTCSVCRLLDGQIFPAESFPPKPHFNCRCKKRGMHDGKSVAV